jgi:uncharacterized protein (TIRG00374 family)
MTWFRAGRRAAAFARANWVWGLAVAGLTALVLAVNPEKLGHVMGQVRVSLLLIMAPVTVAVLVLRGIGWWFALRRIGVNMPVMRAVAVVIASKPMVFLPAGDLGRVAVLDEVEPHGRGAGEVAATIAFQEIGFLLLMLVPLVPAVFLKPALLPLLLFLVLLYGGIVTVLIWEPAYERAVSLVELVPMLRRFDTDLRRIRGAFLRLLSRRTLLGVGVFDALGVALTFVLFELALHAVGVDTVGLLQATVIYAVAYVVSGLTMTPVGFGAYEGIITGFMVLQGVPPSEGAAAALLYRGFNDVLMAILGVAVLLALRRRGEPRAMPAELAAH